MENNKNRHDPSATKGKTRQTRQKLNIAKPVFSFENSPAISAITSRVRDKVEHPTVTRARRESLNIDNSFRRYDFNNGKISVQWPDKSDWDIITTKG